jgi:hypothetical protein
MLSTPIALNLGIISGASAPSTKNRTRRVGIFERLLVLKGEFPQNRR